MIMINAEAVDPTRDLFTNRRTSHVKLRLHVHFATPHLPAHKPCVTNATRSGLCYAMMLRDKD